MFVSRIKKFINDVNNHKQKSCLDQKLIVELENLINGLSNEFKVNPQLVEKIKSIISERGRIPDTSLDYTFESRGINRLWIYLAFELSELTMKVFNLPNLPTSYLEYANSVLLFTDNPDKQLLILVRPDGSKEQFKLKNERQFKKNLFSKIPKQASVISYENLSRALASNDSQSQWVKSYLQILIPSVSNDFSEKKSRFIADSPWITKLFVVNALPDLNRSYINQYIFLKSTCELYYCYEDLDNDFSDTCIQLELLKLSNPATFINKLIQDKGELSCYIFNRIEIKKYVTEFANHIPIELRNYYLGDDDKTLYMLSDLLRSNIDSAHSLVVQSANNKNFRALTIKEFYRIYSKKGQYDWNGLSFKNINQLLKMSVLTDCRFPRYYLMTNDLIDKTNRGCFGFQLAKEKNTISYIYTNLAGESHQFSYVSKDFELTPPLSRTQIQKVFPGILDFTRNNNVQWVDCDLPAGEVLPELLNLVRLYVCSPESMLEAEGINLFKKELISLGASLQEFLPREVNYLYSQSILKTEEYDILILDILIECYALIYAPKITKSQNNLSDQQSISLEKKLIALAKWIALQDPGLIIHHPKLFSMYQSLGLGSALTVSKLLEKFNLLTDKYQLLAGASQGLMFYRQEIEKCVKNDPNSTNISHLVPLIYNLYKCRWDAIRKSPKFEQINYVSQTQDENANWIYLARVLSGTTYFPKKTILHRLMYQDVPIGYFKFLMYTMEEMLESVTRVKQEYFPLYYYIIAQGTRQEEGEMYSTQTYGEAITLLLNSERQVERGKSFLHYNANDSIILPYTPLEYERILRAHPRFHKYVDYVHYELAEYKGPKQIIERNKIYLHSKCRRLFYIIKSEDGEVKTGCFDKNSLDLEYEIYYDFDFASVKHLKPEIITALCDLGIISRRNKVRRLHMSTVLLLKDFVNTTMYVEGFRTLGHLDAKTEDVILDGYTKFIIAYFNLPEDEREALNNHLVYCSSDEYRFGRVLPQSQLWDKEQGDKRFCAALVGRCAFQIVQSYLPSERMKDEIQFSQALYYKIKAISARIERKVVLDTPGEATRYICHILTSMMSHSFEESTGVQLRLWNYINIINTQLQPIAEVLFNYLSKPNFPDVIKISAMVKIKVNELTNYLTIGNYKEKDFSLKTAEWLLDISKGKLSKMTVWCRPFAFVNFFLKIYSNAPDIPYERKAIFTQKEITHFMDMIVQMYMQDSSVIAKEVYFNIALNRYVNVCSLEDKFKKCNLLHEANKSAENISNLAIYEHIKDYFHLRLAELIYPSVLDIPPPKQGYSENCYSVTIMVRHYVLKILPPSPAPLETKLSVYDRKILFCYFGKVARDVNFVRDYKGEHANVDNTLSFISYLFFGSPDPKEIENATKWSGFHFKKSP